MPLPWSGRTPPFGFTSGSAHPWLPQPEAWAAYTAQAQDYEPGSMLTLYRTATGMRRKLTTQNAEAFAWQPSPRGILSFDRGDHWTCVTNVDGDPIQLSGDVILASEPLHGQWLPPNTAAWIAQIHSVLP